MPKGKPITSKFYANKEFYFSKMKELRSLGKTYKEIGKELGFSTSFISNVLKAGPDVMKESIAIWSREFSRRLRIKVLDKLGNRCKHCGFSDPRVLQVDHINGGGIKDITKIGGRHHMYKEIINLSIEDVSKKYQLLCANCNWIKKHDNDETNRKYK